ncbi:hypothetical protein TSH100_13810 [Azospirillum sp. TSH100]|uniref:phage tail length tape measure family protein n=1 Tax=Azospirillum sp. TSH100 TaxID=652764 RepID=UPI000D60A6A0|nr:phage tail length tape measure family protein [Azospirillum sp. TSH100]PWC86046.1 hypothetical protein TSH100_13810 [Azospirillum sp. TSH100]
MAQKKVSVRLSVEADNVDAIRRKLEELGVSIKSVGNDNSPDRLRRQFEALEGRLDTTSRATRKLADDEALLKRAVDELGVSRERANALLKAAKDAYDPAAIAARKEADALRGLIDTLDKTAAANRKVADGQALLDKALAGGVQGTTLTETQHRKLSAALREQHGVLEESASKTKLAAHEMTNLSYQVQDFAVQVGSGQGLFRPLLQQAPQAVGAVGGVSRALSLLLSPIGLTIAAGATLATGLAVISSRAVGIEGQLRSLSVATKAYGTEAQSTAAQLRDLAKALYADGAGKDESEAASKVIATTRGLSSTMAKEIAGIGNDMAAGMGKSVDEMVKQLGSLATEGYPAIKKLQDEIGFLTSDELKAVRAMAEHGQQAQALGVAVEALHRRFDGLRQQSMSPAEQAFRDLGVGWNAFMDAVAQSRPVMEMITGVSGAVTRMAAAVTSTPKEQIADLETRIAAVKKSIATRDGAKADGETYLNLNLRSLLFGTTDGSDLDKQLADLEQQLKAAQGRLVTELAKTPVRVAGTSAGAASAGGKTDEKAVQYVDEQTAAYERLAKAMGGSQAARTLQMASMRAEDEIRERRLSGQEAEDIRDLRRKEALLQLSVAYGDELRSLSLAAQGNVQLAAAYGQSEAAALRQKAANDAQAAAAGNAAVSVAELTRQNVLNAASSTAADAGKAVADLTRQAVAQEKIADAAKHGAAAQAEAERQAQVAAQTSGILAAAQVAEEEGAAELARTLRDLAGAYDLVSRRGTEAQKRTQGEETLRTARQGLDYAQQELALMGQAEPLRNRALKSLQIQQQAQGMAKSATSDQIAEWVKLQEQIADTQALTQYANDVKATSKEIAGSISENLYDRLTDPSKATSVVDFFKSIFKRIGLAALENAVVLPIVTSVVGAAPSLFGVQAPAGAGGIAGAAQGSGGLLSNATSLVSLGRSGWQLLSGGSGLAATQAAGSFATSSLGEALGLSTSAAGVIPEAAATDLMLTSTGNAVVGAAGTIGAAMPYGAIGGFGGAYLSNRFMGGSKVGGALTGAALGAGSAALGASIWGMGAVGGPWGIAAAAVISAVMAMLGSQKKSVGPNSSGNVVLDGAGGFRTDRALADNGADASQMQTVTDSVAKAMTAIIAGVGGKLTGGDGANTGRLQYFAEGNKWFVTPQVGDKAGQKTEFTDQSQAVQFYMRESLKGLIGNGSLTGVNDDVKTVLAKSNATTSEALTKHLQLAATFQDSVDAMNNAIGLEDAARKQGKTAAADLTTAIKDFRQTASDAGLDATKAANATRNWIDTLVSGADPKTYTVYEAQAAQFRAQWSNMGDVLQAVGYSAADAAKKMDEGLGNALKKLAKTLNTSLDQQINAALGRDFLNQITKALEDEQTNARDLAAVGEPITKAQTLRAAQLNSIMTQLNATQLDVITSTYGATSDIGKLGQTIKAMGTDAGTAAANLASFQADVQSRMYAALGNDRGSQLIALDAQQAKALAEAQAAGYDMTALQQVQAAERAAKAFQLAQADVLGAYDQQITAQQDYITGLTNGAMKIAQSARQFRSAFDALALNDNSPLSDLERLKEARRQAAVDYATYKDTTKSDEDRDAAKQDLLSIGPTLIQLARSYFGPTDSTDYKWMRSVFAEFGDTTALGVDTAESTLKTANDTLKEMQKSRAEAAALGQKQYAAVTDLTGIMQRSYLVYQAQLTALQKLTGTTSTTAPVTTVDRTVEQKRAQLEAFSNADIERYFGGFSDIIAARDADPLFNLAKWFKEFGIGEVLSGARIIPGFATGTPSAPPGLAWVGEEGPELVRLAGGERVFPHDASIEMAQRFNAANDRLPAGVTSFRPRLAASDAGVGAMVSELRKFREEARQDARAIADTVIDMMEKQITALRDENAELRRRIDKQSQEIRLGQAVPQYAMKGR